MKNNGSNQELRKMYSAYPFTAAVLLALSSSVAYLIKRRNEKIECEKWKDYDQCGI